MWCAVCGLLKLYDFIFLRAYAELFAVVEDMGTMARVDALDEVVLAGVGGVEYHVDRGAVEGDGVERGEDAYVAHFGGGGSQSQSTESLLATLM